MTVKEKYEIVDKFLTEISEKSESDIVCPACKTPLEVKFYGASYEVVCQTENCLVETFRGI